MLQGERANKDKSSRWLRLSHERSKAPRCASTAVTVECEAYEERRL